MIPSLITVLAAFIWLLIESDWLRIRLLVGRGKPPAFAQYTAYNSLRTRKTYDVQLRHGSNAPEPCGTMYNVVFSPGVTEPLCGWEWLDKHCADMVDFNQVVDLVFPDVRYHMTIKQAGILDKVMKVNKYTKAELQKFAVTA